MLVAKYKKHVLNFNTPAGTSRGVLKDKNSWFLYIWDTDKPNIMGIGECSIIPKLSIDDPIKIEKILHALCDDINNYTLYHSFLKENFPSINFALEMALLDLKNGGKSIYFDSEFSRGEIGIPINGLIWMGTEEYMKTQMIDKINQFSCIKMKIGAISFEKELSIIKWLRKTYGYDFELRLDANGAFSLNNVDEILSILSEYNIHSIEQPIKQGQWNEMAKLCKRSPIPIVLDEELIGVNSSEDKINLLDKINPDYIILKPSLLGGFEASNEWITLAELRGIKWWITSALESNIGLNAIAQWCSTYNNKLPQGLGTGSIYSNNIDSLLEVKNGFLFYNAKNNVDVYY